MKKNKILIISIISVLVIGLGITISFFLLKEDKTTTLNIIEKQWIESNKNQRFDFSVVTDIPLFSYNGEGIFLDFLDNIEEVTGLEFNRISSKLGSEQTSDYGFNIVDEVGENDILIYEDNYVLLSSTGVRYEDLSQINNLVVGVMNKDVTNVDYFLKGANVTYKTCDEPKGLFDAITNDPKNNIVPVVDAIVIPKTVYLDQILKYSSYGISYNITELSKKYVLTLGDNERLNDILTKYYEKWSVENFDEHFNDYLFNIYFNTSNIDEKQKVQFRSKRYYYGFVENIPFDTVDNGINNKIIHDFMDFSNIEISFEKYNNYEDIVKSFNENSIDFMFNNLANTEYAMDTFETVSNYDENFVIATKKNNNTVINSINSLANNNIHIIGNTKIESYLNTQGFEIESYKNIEQLVNETSTTDLVVLDYFSYKYYMEKYFSDYEIKYIFDLNDDYNYIIRDISDNEIFCGLFNFYLSFMNDKSVINSKFNNVIEQPVNTFNYRYLIIAGSVIALLLILFIIIKITKKNKNSFSNLSKEDKLHYIDMLTSLKNRNYLNDNIEKWDSSEVYPQTIIIADLNNVAYINDNYGHNEGDNLIREASNILIKNQIANSEIIRTNGNEFLIYLVGYEEKQIISYIRKLNKEFKELAHGFGVALGYSMINDAIKTIDDAINEATLEMRNNKEEANN